MLGSFTVGYVAWYWKIKFNDNFNIISIDYLYIYPCVYVAYLSLPISLLIWLPCLFVGVPIRWILYWKNWMIYSVRKKIWLLFGSALPPFFFLAIYVSVCVCVRVSFSLTAVFVCLLFLYLKILRIQTFHHLTVNKIRFVSCLYIGNWLTIIIERYAFNYFKRFYF